MSDTESEAPAWPRQAPPWMREEPAHESAPGVSSGSNVQPADQTASTGRPWRPRAWITVSLVAAVVGGLVGAGVATELAHRSPQTVIKGFSPNTSLLPKVGDVQGILQRVLPAVVSIGTRSFQPGRGSLGLGGPAQGAGTGMIISPDGEVLTNDHVVMGATSVKVTVYGQKDQLPAHVVGTDPADDIALVKIEGVKGLPTVTLGNSDQPRVGDSVLAMGNALALLGGPSVTEGIVSAEHRNITAGGGPGSASESLGDVIQTDAAINPGNSGGPLVNAQAQVIGMNTAVAQSGGNNAPAQNVGFAIAINNIKPRLNQLRSGQSLPARAFLGVEAETLTPDLRATYGFTASKGAVIVSVTPGSPAENAGVQVADVVTAVDATSVSTNSDLVKDVEAHKPGTKVSVTVMRGTQTLKLSLTLGSRPAGL